MKVKFKNKNATHINPGKFAFFIFANQSQFNIHYTYTYTHKKRKTKHRKKKHLDFKEINFFFVWTVFDNYLCHRDHFQRIYSLCLEHNQFQRFYCCHRIG